MVDMKSRNVSEKVRNKIRELPKGSVFNYADVMDENKNVEAVVKALNRLAASGQIKKLSKGKFYKPENSPFGKLPPDQTQIVKDLLESDGIPTGYLTGFSIFNNFGLTTQVSNIIQIGKNDVRPAFKREGYTISFVRQKNKITKDNIPMLQLLDALRYIKRIPDATIVSAVKRFLTIMSSQTANDKKSLINLSLKYPPSTRALLGALLESTGNISLTASLHSSLNPITTYQYTGIDSVLTSAKNWYLKS